MGDSGGAEKAAETALRQALKAVPKPDLAIAFSSIHLDQRKVHKALCRRLDPAILTGGSSFTEITNAGASKNSVALLLLSLEGLKTSFSVSEAVGDCRRTGLELAKDVPLSGAAQKVGLLFSAITAGYDQQMVSALEERLRAPVFGGLSCGDFEVGMNHPDFWKCYQYCGGALEKKGARLALLEFPAAAKLSFACGHGWEPVGEALTVTRAEGPMVYEVNGMPVIDFYRQFLGRDANDKFFEVMVQRYAFAMQELGAGRSLLKLPVSCDFKKGCITYFPAADMNGRTVRLIQASRLNMIDGARAAAAECAAGLNGAKPDLVLMVSCCSRSHILHSRVNDEVAAVRSVFGKDTPLFGFYSAGEIAPWHNATAKAETGAAQASHYHTGTVALMALSCGGAKASVPAETARSARKSTPRERRAEEMLRVSEEFLDTTESFLANLSRKTYKDGALLRRQHEIIHAYTPHGVWKEAGAVASSGGEELKDAEFSGVFMFMDVKGFTPYTEAHTSAEVVKALNEIFSPATDLIYKHGGDVDKFIGDCIFACFDSAGNAARAARDILLLFRGLNARGNPFNVRIGLNNGRAVRANVGAPSRREYTFIGDAVNTAQRLESNCESGKVLVSAGVYEQAAGVFTNAVERSVTLKGKRLPMTAYQCEAD